MSDISELTRDEKLVIEKIQKLLDKDDVLVFSNEEIVVIRKMITVYQTLMAFGKAGSLIKNVIVGIATFLGAYLVIQNWGVGVLKHLLGL